MKNELFVTAREQRRSWEFSNHKWFFGLPVFQRMKSAPLSGRQLQKKQNGKYPDVLPVSGFRVQRIFAE